MSVSGKCTVHTPTWKMFGAGTDDVQVETQSSWTRYYAGCHQVTSGRDGLIHTRSRFRAWAKKAAAKHYNFKMPTEEEFLMLPTKCWHGYS